MLKTIIAIAYAVAVIVPSQALAAAPRCRAEDPAAAGDSDAVQAVRQQIAAACDCSNFPADGPKSRHGAYVKCAKEVVNAAVESEQLRTQCKKLALYPFALSTCGYPGTPTVLPCIKATKKGPACKITTCTSGNDLPCPARDDCLAAADTNHDGQVSVLDSGQCNVLDCAAAAELPAAFADARTIACYNGCGVIEFSQCLDGCLAGYDAAFETAASIREVCEADPAVACDDMLAAALQHCATPPPLPPSCVAECSGRPVCEEKCAWTSDCTAVAEELHRVCLTTNY